MSPEPNLMIKLIGKQSKQFYMHKSGVIRLQYNPNHSTLDKRKQVLNPIIWFNISTRRITF